MVLYKINGALPPADEYANILGMLVGKPEAKFDHCKNRWTIVLMQSEEQILTIKYESESAQEDLYLRRLDHYSGTIVFIMGLDLTSLDRFGYAELIHSKHLLVLTLENVTVADINKFLKAGYQIT